MSLGDITYLRGSVDREYAAEVFAWIGSVEQKASISNAANVLGISAESVAGAMAEEYDAYLMHPTRDQVLDQLALNRFTSHAEWSADYATQQATLDEVHDLEAKLAHPVLTDLGYSNIRMGTAIRLVEKYATEYPTLDLAKYTAAFSGYALLAQSLVDPDSDVSAKIAALMIKEADDWFRAQGAAGPGGIAWDLLPPEYRDALYVTYFNLGPKKMAELKKIPYEPQPALGTGGGMNHLLNAAQIGAAIGNPGYGSAVAAIPSVEELILRANQEDASGSAYRYALLHLRYVVVEAEYAGESGAQLELYDDATGTGEITAQWIETRSRLLVVRTAALASGDTDGEFDLPFGLPFWQFGDTIVTDDTLNGFTITIDGWDAGVVDPRYVRFGNHLANTLLGDTRDDLLFGAAGDDTLSGADGNDYLEGGSGTDHLDGGAGDDTLLGGEGNDVLTGGSGRDILDGGAGVDSYTVGHDAQGATIRDADGAGFITIERSDSSAYTLVASSANEIAGSPGHYQDTEGNRYQFNGDDLIVSLEGGRRITIEDFQTMPGNRLGITLQTVEPYVPPSGVPTFDVGAPNQIIADQDEAFQNENGWYRSSGTDGGSWLSAGAVFHRLDTEVINATSAIDNPATDQYWVAGVKAGFGDSHITGDSGANVIYDDWEARFDAGPGIYGEYQMGGQMGNDRIDAGAGDDWIITRGGDDEVHGGSGNDVIIDTHSGWEARIAEGTSYFYQWGSTEWVTQAAHSSDDILLGGESNDYIAAHGGAQTIDGGADNDEIFAGAGNDVLSGGDGNDVLGGDRPGQADRARVSTFAGAARRKRSGNGALKFLGVA